MERLRKVFVRIESGAVVLVFTLTFTVVFLQFFTRYVLNNSLGWTEEIARALLICLCFVGAVVNARENSEIALEFVRSKLKTGWAKRLETRYVQPVTALMYFWLAGLMGYYTLKSRQYLASIPLSKNYIIGIACVSLFLMGFHKVAHIVVSLRTEPVER